MTITIERDPPVTTVILSRPDVRNAIDRDTAEELAAAFRAFEQDDAAKVAVLYGDHGQFCAGADLKAVAAGRPNRLALDGDGPLGPTRMILDKPVIAAIAGHAVAGGLELALWCDMRVAERDAILGVFCRRFGVPLIDGGTVRLPHIVGLGRALDLIMTGRPVATEEAYAMGLVDRVVEPGQARREAEAIALQLASFPQDCLRSDRRSVYAALGMSLSSALRSEYEHGRAALESSDLLKGATRFSQGAGRHGRFDGD
ncbi:MAG TPA: crotonase/enoyl-CoA hydratase family protein [Nannocystaceae bacterium]|nr:crotonase/enoyl-CoA hydratase family protein [Nannocystaceae bacterium]